MSTFLEYVLVFWVSLFMCGALLEEGNHKEATLGLQDVLSSIYNVLKHKVLTTT